MKLNKIALAIATVALAPLATAGVTVTPLVGYHYSDAEDTSDAQRKVLKTGKNLNVNKNGDIIDTTKTKVINNGGVAKESGLYTGVALGVDITPSTQFQVEYGVANQQGEASEKSAKAGVNRFDVEQQTISGNFLIGSDKVATEKLKPYVLVGAGQSRIKVENQQTYQATGGKNAGKTIPAGTEVSSTKDTIGNLGVGAKLQVNDNLSLRGEARAVRDFDNKWWEGLALGGLEVKLGAKKAPVAPPPVVEPTVEPKVVVKAPKDSDRDGVIDSRDKCPGTATNLVVDANGCPRKLTVPEDLKMELRVFFDNNKADVKEQFKPEIAKVAQGMNAYPNSVARIEGHASKTGPSARYNQRLSEARAVAVKSVLSNEFGINPSRIQTKGFGYSRPIAPNNTAEGRAMNRRVYAIITGTKKVTVNQTKNMK